MFLKTLFSALGFGLLGYLCGSLPFAVWITRLFKRVDVREAGSGHATTTNTIRQAVFLPGALVLVLDMTKGYIPAWLALHYAPASLIVPLTAAVVVVGHCWPSFAGFRGGMGLAPSASGLTAAAPIAFFIGPGVLIALLLILHHSARASALTGILVAPVLWLFGLRGAIIWIAVAEGVVVACRFLIDWNRQYRELWLDREKEG